MAELSHATRTITDDLYRDGVRDGLRSKARAEIGLSVKVCLGAAATGSYAEGFDYGRCYWHTAGDEFRQAWVLQVSKECVR